MMSAWKLWAVSNLWSRRGNSPQPKGASKHSQFLPGVKDNLRALRGETGPFPETFIATLGPKEGKGRPRVAHKGFIISLAKAQRNEGNGKSLRSAKELIHVSEISQG